jgi:hypothetical protein
LCFGHVTSPDGAASLLPPPKPRHGKKPTGQLFSGQGGTQRAHSNAPIAQQCQWFLSNLIALSVPPLDTAFQFQKAPHVGPLTVSFDAAKAGR